LIIFETGNLLVRPFTVEDADSFFQINSNEQVMRYIRPVKSRQNSNVFLTENILHYEAYPGAGRWAVVEKSSNSIIGMFSLLFLEQGTAKLHIGYALLPDYWNKGYATVLLKAGTARFLEGHPNEILYAITRKENIASEKVLLKCGFERAGEYKENENLWTMKPLHAGRGF
jgi:ribosomal-protein-alanine N-acetyltransferase